MNKAYDKTNWIDHVTLVDARKLNKVEDALEINANNIGAVDKKVEDLYGLITKPNVAPVISSSHSKVNYADGEIITIDFDVFDPENSSELMGVFQINENIEEGKVKLGINTWTVGKLPRGRHKLYLYLRDGATVSNILSFYINVGSLEITSRFDDNRDFSEQNDIMIYYNIITLSSDDKPLISHYLDEERVYEGIQPEGSNYTFNIGRLPQGLHTARIYGQLENASFELNYNLIILSETGTILSTKQDMFQKYEYGQEINLEYKLSTFEESTDVVYTIDGNRVPGRYTITPGINSFTLPKLELGVHEVQIQAATESSTHDESNVLTFVIDVYADFEIIRPIIDDTLEFYFDAEGKTNADEIGRIGWIDKSRNNVKAYMNNFNYISNGWFNGYLRMNGDSNVIIDYKPFENDITMFGGTLEIVYRYTEVGNKGARILSCKDPEAPFTGIDINADVITMNTLGRNAVTFHNEGELLHVTYSFNRIEGWAYVYINGVICAPMKLDTIDKIITDSKIYLNCDVNVNGEVQNFSECDVKLIRYYKRSLDDREVLNNFTSTKVASEQQEILARNEHGRLSTLKMYGNFEGMNADDQVPLRIKFDRSAEQINDLGLVQNYDFPACLVDWQGNSSLQYAVKNYNIDLYEDGKEKKVQMMPLWPKADSYHIKANMMDSSGSTNLCIGRFLNGVYDINLPTGGQYAVQGFPIEEYNNNTQIGVFTYNQKQHRDVFGLSKSNPNHWMYRAEENSAEGAAAFKKWGDADILAEWEERHPKKSASHQEFGQLIQWVYEATDEDFRNSINNGDRLNKEFLLDYYLMCYLFGMVDSLGKNLTMTCWNRSAEGNLVWYPMFYDMDTALGCNNQGELIRSFDGQKVELVHPSDTRCPEDYNTGGSILWEKTLRVFSDDIKARYATLRRKGNNQGFSMEAFEHVFFKGFIDTIGETNYNNDTRFKYLPYDQGYLYMARGNKIQQYKKWFKERLLYCDTMFNFTTESGNSIIIRNRISGLMTLRIKSEVTQRITVDFGGGPDGVQSKSVGPDEYTEFSYNFAGVYQRDISISGANKITHFEGIDNMDLIMLDIQFATRLQHLSATNNRDLSYLNTSSNTRLISLDVSGCTNMSTPIDVSNAVNLRSLNVSNTTIPAIYTTNALYLEYLNISNTKIATVELNKQAHLKTLDCSGVDTVSYIHVNECGSLVTINATNCIALREISVRNCAEFKILNVNGSTRLDTISLEDLPKYEQAIFRSMIGLKSLNLSKGLEAITKIDVTNCGALANITLGELPKLKMLEIPGTIIQTLDLSNTNSTLSSLNCGDVSEIIGLNFDGYAGMLFNYKPQLTRVTGEIHSHDFWNIFGDCPNIVEVPSLHSDMSGASFSGAFMNCQNLASINIVGSVGDISYLADGCQSLTSISPLNIDNELVYSVANAFKGTSELTSVEFIVGENLYLDEAGIVVANRMFIDSGIQNVIVSGNMNDVFAKALALETIPNLTIKSAQTIDTSEIFNKIENLIIHNFTGDKVNLSVKGASDLQRIVCDRQYEFTYVPQMFRGCLSLQELVNVHIDTSNVRDLSYTFYNCQSLSTFPTISSESATNMSYMFYNCSSLTSDYVNSLNFDSATNISYLLDGCSGLTGQVIINAPKATGIVGLFKDCENIESPIINTSALITDFSYLFYGCRNIKALSLDNLGLERATNATSTFENMYFPTGEVTIGELYKVQDVRRTFAGATLRKVDIGTQATTYTDVFADANIGEIIINDPTLTSIGKIGTPNLIKVTIKAPNARIDGTFMGASNIEEIDVSQCYDMGGVDTYNGCTSLRKIIAGSNRKTPFADRMFLDCSELTTIEVVGNPNYNPFSTSYYSTLHETFKNCSKLTIFDNQNATYVFSGVNNSAVDYVDIFYNSRMPKSVTLESVAQRNTARNFTASRMFYKAKGGDLITVINALKGSQDYAATPFMLKDSCFVECEFNTLKIINKDGPFQLSSTLRVSNIFTNSTIENIIIDYYNKTDSSNDTKMPSQVIKEQMPNTFKNYTFEGISNDSHKRFVVYNQLKAQSLENINIFKFRFSDDKTLNLDNLPNLDWETKSAEFNIYIKPTGVNSLWLRNNGITNEQLQVIHDHLRTYGNSGWTLTVYATGNNVTQEPTPKVSNITYIY